MCGLQTGTCLSYQIERYWEEVEREREKAFCLVDWMTFCWEFLRIRCAVLFLWENISSC